MPDLEAVAASLAETAANLDAHIQRRAQEIASPRIADIEYKAYEQVSRAGTRHAHETRRKDDLIAELRRQLDAAVRTNERLHREGKDAKEAIRRVEMLRVWVNEDRKQFYFADDVWEALGDCGSPATRYLASLGRRDGCEATDA